MASLLLRGPQWCFVSYSHTIHMLRPSPLSSPKLLPILLLLIARPPQSTRLQLHPLPRDFHRPPPKWSLCSPHPFPLDSDLPFQVRPPTLDLTPAFSSLYGLLSFLHLPSLLLPPFPSLSPQTPSLLPSSHPYQPSLLSAKPHFRRRASFLPLCLPFTSCSREVASVTIDSLRPCGLAPARLLCPWDSLGESTGMGWPFSPPGDLPKPRIELASPVS